MRKVICITPYANFSHLRIYYVEILRHRPKTWASKRYNTKKKRKEWKKKRYYKVIFKKKHRWSHRMFEKKIFDKIFRLLPDENKKIIEQLKTKSKTGRQKELVLNERLQSQGKQSG